MSNPSTITGIWHGTYFYDSLEQQIRDPHGVDFELRLNQSFWGRLFGLFEGTVTDDPVRGMPDTGTIRGSFHAPNIRFIKGMPVAYTIVDGRIITVRESLQKQGHHIEDEIPHAPIIYEGTFQADGTASGIWIIEENIQELPDGLSLPIARCTGTWILRR